MNVNRDQAETSCLNILNMYDIHYVISSLGKVVFIGSHILYDNDSKMVSISQMIILNDI